MDKFRNRIFCAFIMMLVLSICTVSYAFDEQDIHSNEALLVNMKNDKVLFSKNADDNAVPIASLTKLMTFAIAVENVSDLENTFVNVPQEILDNVKSRGASVAGLISDYKYSMKDLLYGLMLPSGCDCADVIANYISNGNMDSFVNMMNTKAKKLEMNNTIYVDATGLGIDDKNDCSTEQDLYKLIKYLYKKYPIFKEIISTEYYEIQGIKGNETDSRYVHNTNYLIGEYDGGKYYYPYSIGGKSGTLSIAGRCLATIAEKGDFAVVAITLGVPGEYSSDFDYHLTDNQKLIEYAFENYSENIYIDITGPELRSIAVGEEITFDTTLSGDKNKSKITWTSSNSKVANVDNNGTVKGIRQGLAKITAETSTGNKDYIYISVGFYNGVHTKYSTGPSNNEGGWNPIDWNVIKEKGFDYVIIRAGYGNETQDKTFVQNMHGAIEKGINVGIWYEGYAESIEDAEVEANNLIRILNNNFENLNEYLSIPIIYNLFYSNVNDPETLCDITIKFKNVLAGYGYRTMLELGRTKLKTMDLEKLKENDVEFCIIYRSTIPDHSVKMSANDIEADMWNYKANAYLGEDGIGTNASLSALYMDYIDLRDGNKADIRYISVFNCSDWAEEEIEKAYDYNLISENMRYSDLKEEITREEFATIAVRMYEKITESEIPILSDFTFSDTDNIDVLKAYSIGITNGTTETTFSPQKLITREEIATMLARTIQKSGIDLQPDLINNEDMKFDDDNEISEWSKDSVYYMCNLGVIKGVGQNKYFPLENATREQALLISERSIEKIIKI